MLSQSVNIRSVAISLAAYLFVGAAAGLASAQMLTNLDDTMVFYDNIAQSNWMAQPFITGSDPGGYSLSTVGLNLYVVRQSGGGGGGDALPSDYGPLNVSIYSSTGGSVGSLVANGLLSDSANVTTGLNVWSPATGNSVLLAPSSQYWIVATTTATQPEYAWAGVTTGSSTSDDNWTIPAGYDYSSNQGTSWQTSTATVLFSVNAVDAVPEPKAWKLALVAFGIAGLLKCARRGAGLAV